MDRIWLKNYPPGVPADIDAGQYLSLVALFEESFAKYQGQQMPTLAWTSDLTYGDLDRSRGLWEPGCRARACSGRTRRRHAAQCAAVPGVRRRHPAGGVTWW